MEEIPIGRPRPGDTVSQSMTRAPASGHRKTGSKIDRISSQDATSWDAAVPFGAGTE